MMKKIISLFFCTFIFISVQAQKIIPQIKAGSVITASANMGDDDIPVQFTIISLETPMVIGWEVENYGGGSFEMTAKGVENANQLYLSQPNLGKISLNDSQTFLIISKSALKSIIENKIFTYNNINFSLKPSDEVIKINGAETDAIRLVSADEKIEIWILNNANFPLIVKSKGLPTNVVVSEIK